jgi:hypothetical protein
VGPLERVPRYCFGLVVADLCGRDIEGIYFGAQQVQRIKECSFQEQGFCMQEQLIQWLVSMEE